MNAARALGCALLLGAGAAAGGGCAVAVDGDFDGLAFSPARTAEAILDSHTILQRQGALLPVERARAQMRVDLWLSGADLPVDDDWRHLPSERLLDVRKDLASHDLLVLRGMDFDALQDGRLLVAQTTADDAARGVARGAGDFTFSLGQQVAEGFDQDGIGGKVTVEVEASRLDREEPRGGSLRATVVVIRERAADQPASDLATGTVTLQLDLPLAPERLAEANLATVDPIARCVAESGPDAGLACATVEADPVVDERGSF